MVTDGDEEILQETIRRPYEPDRRHPLLIPKLFSGSCNQSPSVGKWSLRAGLEYSYAPFFYCAVHVILVRFQPKMEVEREETWVLGPSQRSLACYNPIRSLVEKSFLPALQRCDKEVFKLATGTQPCFTVC